MHQPPLVIAHRGASHSAPENTLPAFALAWQEGADAIECDLRLTGDGEAVACHDATLRRTTGDPRNLRDLHLAEVKQLDAGSWKDRRFAGTTIPTLQETLESVPSRGRVVLELKERQPLLDRVQSVLSARRDLHITLIAFDYDTIVKTKMALPMHRALWLVDQLDEMTLPRVQDAHLDGIDLRYSESLRPDLLEPFHAANLTIYTYTVNAAPAARHCRDLRLHGVTTDEPGRIRREIYGDNG